MSEPDLILHVKGTENETKSLPKQAVRAAIAQGQISRSQLIWSPVHNAWKQVRELPHLWPSQKLAPAPDRRPSIPIPKMANVPQPRISSGAPQAAAVPQPRVKMAAKASASVAAQPAEETEEKSEDYKVAEKPHFNPLKWLCLVLIVFILGALGYNYVAVEQPLLAGMNDTAYASKATVYAHLGGFMQRDALEIHIFKSPAIDKTNLTSFLVAVAHSTPQKDRVFERISLTSGFMGQYSMAGSTWKEFGDMGQADPEQQKKFLLDQLIDSSGQSLVYVTPNMTSEAQNAAREKAWNAFVADFTSP